MVQFGSYFDLSFVVLLPPAPSAGALPQIVSFIWTVATVFSFSVKVLTGGLEKMQVKPQLSQPHTWASSPLQVPYPPGASLFPTGQCPLASSGSVPVPCVFPSYLNALGLP